MKTKKFIFTSLAIFLSLIQLKAQETPVKSFSLNHDIINCIAISPDGKLVATGGDDNYVEISNIDDGNIIYSLPLESKAIYLEFSKDGDYLLSVTKREVYRLTISNKLSKKVDYFSSIKNAHFSPEDNKIFVNATLSMSGQKGLYSFNIENKQYTRVENETNIRDFKIYYPGWLIYVMTDNRILKYDLTSYKLLNSYSSLSSLSSFDISSDNKFIAATTNEDHIIIFDTNDGTKSISLETGSEPLTVKIGPDNSYLGIAKKNMLKINKLDNITTTDNSNHTVTKKLLSFHADTINTGETDINDFIFTPDNKYVLLATRTSKLTIWKNSIKNLSTTEVPVNEKPTVSKTVAVNNTKTVQTPKNNQKEITSADDLTDDFIYKNNKADIDRELDLRPALFAPKGEFEKTSDYEARMKEAAKYRSSIIDFYRKKYLAQIKFQKYLDSMNVVRQADMIKQKIKDSYMLIALSIQKLGMYNADQEYFPVIINGNTDTLKMPIDDAKTFKPNYKQARVIAHQQLESDGVTLDTFNIFVVHPISNKYYPVGKQVKPLYVDASEMSLPESNPEPSYRNVTASNVNDNSNSNSGIYLDQEFIDGLKKRKNYGLFISVDNYIDPQINDLDDPDNDANKLFETLNQHYGFDTQNSIVLRDPTRVQIINAFDKLTREVTSNDQLLIFYAGHGYWDKTLEQGFWLPTDARKDSKAEWISNSTIRDYIRGIGSKHTLLIADACFSGGIFKSRELFSTQAKAAAELYRLPSRKAITSGTMTAVPDKSVFMHYIIKRLNENTNPLLTGSQLFSSIREAVINNSTLGQIPQFGEIQSAGDEGGNFIFVVR